MVRSAGLWLGARAITAVVLANAELPPFPHSTQAALLIVLLTTMLCFADVWYRHERALIGNLGVSPWTFAAMSAVPPALAEACVVAAVSIYS